MGIVIDTSIFIAHERSRHPISELVHKLIARYPGAILATSVITIAELTHGVYRSPSPATSARRQSYINQIEAIFEVVPVSLSLAHLLGQLDGQQTAKGQIVGIEDLIIAATAIQRGDSILTLNSKHFTLIPGITVLAP